jgi:peroxiredoxin
MLKKTSYGDRLALLETIVLYYPPADSFHGIAEREFLKLDGEWQDYLTEVTKTNKGSVAEVVIRWDQLPDISVEKLNPAVKSFYRENYFKEVSSEDTLIIRTPILPVKIIDYLTLYVIPGAPRMDQESSFIEGVDAIMAWTGNQKSMKETVINYLIEGFQAYGFEEVLTHIVEKYVVDQSCVSDQEESVLKQRIEGFKKMAVGKKAPDFELPDPDGNTIRLSKIDRKYKLLFFWASWCPHCNAMADQLITLYGEYSEDVEFVGVSIDEDENDWKASIKEKGLPWKNLSDLKGWDGKVVNDYYIYATPTLYLVDENLNIIAKPAGIGELEDTLRGL